MPELKRGTKVSVQTLSLKTHSAQPDLKRLSVRTKRALCRVFGKPIITPKTP